MRVYLDAVLNPLLEKNNFLQEGWRFSIENGELKYKGIVLNEMKGVYEKSDNFFHWNLVREILKGTEYKYDSGGVPGEIQKLSYEEFRDFH